MVPFSRVARLHRMGGDDHAHLVLMRKLRNCLRAKPVYSVRLKSDGRS